MEDEEQEELTEGHQTGGLGSGVISSGDTLSIPTANTYTINNDSAQTWAPMMYQSATHYKFTFEVYSTRLPSKIEVTVRDLKEEEAVKQVETMIKDGILNHTFNTDDADLLKVRLLRIEK